MIKVTTQVLLLLILWSAHAQKDTNSTMGTTDGMNQPKEDMNKPEGTHENENMNKLEQTHENENMNKPEQTHENDMNDNKDMTNTQNSMECPVNCKQCFNSSSCKSCDYGYCFQNDSLSCTRIPSSGSCTFMNEKNQSVLCAPGCISCSDRKTCLECRDGYIRSENKCAPCIIFCLTCKQSNPNLCQTCFIGYFLRSDSSQCLKCSENCLECTDSSVCTKCNSHFGLLQNKCKPCNDSYCLQCDNNQTQCSKCESSFTVRNSICQQCLIGCGKCDGNITICEQCGNGFYQLTSSRNNFECQDCPQNCLICASENECISCFNDTHLSKQKKCIPNCDLKCATCKTDEPSFCLSCFAGYNGPTQGKCVENLQCNTDKSCQTCPVSHILTSQSVSQSSCRKCQVPNCGLCLNSTKCDICDSTYRINVDGGCSKCPQHCLQCQSQNYCSQCFSGFLPISGVCRQCPPNCNMCIGSLTRCTMCSDQFGLSLGRCLSNKNVNFTLTLANDLTDFLSKIRAFKLAIMELISQTDSRSVILSKIQGSTVVQGRVQIQPNATNEQQTFQSLQNAFKANNNFGGDFTVLSSNVNRNGFGQKDEGQNSMECPVNCKQCFNSSSCKSCDYGYCFQSDSLSCTRIPSSGSCTFMNEKNQSVLCAPGCISCSDRKTCLECRDGYIKSENTCAPCNTSCLTCNESNPSLCQTCFIGYFLMRGSSQCHKCSENCLECTDSSVCTKCNSHFGLLQNKCKPCNDSYCLQCDNNQTQCSKCESSFTVRNSICQQCLIGCGKCDGSIAVCEQCGNGFYQLTSSRNNFECQDCPQNCLICASETECISCFNDTHLSNQKKCIPNCDLKCATCKTDEPSFCLSCFAGYNGPTQGKCVENLQCNTDKSCQTCPVSHILTSQSDSQSVCKKCQVPNCGLCLNSTKCDICDSTYRINIEGGCTKCPQHCLQCQAQNYCSQCFSGFLPISGVCRPCHPNCNMCLGSLTRCTMCSDQFELSLGRCLSNKNVNFTLTLTNNLTDFLPKIRAFKLAIMELISQTDSRSVILSKIQSGSTVVQGRVQIQPNATNEQQTFQSLQNAFKANNNFGGFTVLSSNVNRNGFNQNQGVQSGNSLLLPLVLGIGIPLLIGIIVIVVVVCVKMKKPTQQPQKQEVQSAKYLN